LTYSFRAPTRSRFLEKLFTPTDMTIALHKLVRPERVPSDCGGL